MKMAAHINTSRLSDEETARTCYECALQRAENIAVLGGKSVLELCVGPSLRTLEKAYAEFGIKCKGNDIDIRWKKHYNKGDWEIGNCFEVDWSTDVLVFAPPVTQGCTGKRIDSLRISEVFPRYKDFLDRPFSGIKVMVLPARSLATREDRKEMYELLNGREYELVPLFAERRRIRKYVDVYLREK